MVGGRKRLELMEAESERKRKATGRGEREGEAEAGEEAVSCNFGLVPMRVAACGDCSARLAGWLPPCAPGGLFFLRPFLVCRCRVREVTRRGWGATPGRGLAPIGVPDAEFPNCRMQNATGADL